MSDVAPPGSARWLFPVDWDRLLQMIPGVARPGVVTPQVHLCAPYENQGRYVAQDTRILLFPTLGPKTTAVFTNNPC
jgi:hypothetical protein